MPAPAISLESLHKHYGAVVALRDVSFEVHEGETFGFLGLNGAGKTTAIRILLDLVRPSAGRAFVFGADCRRHPAAVRAQVGYLPGELGFYADMTGAATLDLLARLNGSRPRPERRLALVDRLGLSDSDLRRSIREYSTGMKRKLGLVQALEADRPLVILDEPTDGLDPLMQDAVYDLLADAKRNGRTVFMSSHVLPEVERVCDRIALLRRGELVLVSPVDAVRRLAGRMVRLVFSSPVPAPDRDLGSDCDVVDARASEWTLRVRGPLGPVLSRVAPRPVADLHVEEAHLEDVLRQYYRDEPAP